MRWRRGASGASFAALLSYVGVMLETVILSAWSGYVVAARCALGIALCLMTAWCFVLVVARPATYIHTAEPPPCLTVKRSNGSTRWCSKCGAPKPDRCHHCRTCGRCVVRMDHHCPWLMDTCIGFRNYKPFVLLLTYSVLLCIYTLVTCVQACIRLWPRDDTMELPITWMVLTGFAFFFAVVLTPFLGFHIFLMLHNMTTLEFIEGMSHVKVGEAPPLRARLRLHQHPKLSRPYRLYDVGKLANLRQVLGDSVFMWWLPTYRPSGDGLTYPVNELELQAMQDELRTLYSASRGGAPHA